MTDRALPAYLNRNFLESDEGRPIRILSEYLEPLKGIRKQRVRDTIVFFGSARIRPDGPLGRYYDEAREFARLVTEWSKEVSTDCLRFVVCTGGGPGIMEAANRGASDAGGKSIGLNIGLPHEQEPNPYITEELSFEFRYFFMRKLWFAYLAKAIVVFPGGFGTLDELFEILTLSQTEKLNERIPVLLYGRSFWEEVLNLPALVRHGMIAQEDLELFHYVESPEEGVELLRRTLEVEAGPETPHLPKSKLPTR